MYLKIIHVGDIIIDREKHSLQKPDPQRSCQSHSYHRQRVTLISQTKDFCQGSGNSKEKMSIDGSPVGLIYTSGRAHGLNTRVDLKLLTGARPQSLRFVSLDIVVEGRRLETVLEAEDDLEYQFYWDRRDVYGQKVVGVADLVVKAGYK